MDDIKLTEEHPIYGEEYVASMMECTGLVPSAVIDEAEAKAYGELYSIHPPKEQDSMSEHSDGAADTGTRRNK